MRKLSIFLIVSMLSVGLLGCEGMSRGDAGLLTGAAAGALLGSTVGRGSGRAAAIAAGAVIGGAIGSEIGDSMDRQDRMEMTRALEKNRDGRASHWVNPNNGYDYEVTPTKTYYRGSRACREYTTTAIIGGKKQRIYGTACRTSDGDWKIVK